FIPAGRGIGIVGVKNSGDEFGACPIVVIRTLTIIEVFDFRGTERAMEQRHFVHGSIKIMVTAEKYLRRRETIHYSRRIPHGVISTVQIKGHSRRNLTTGRTVINCGDMIPYAGA